VLDELDAVWRGRVERMAGRPNASSQAFESGVLNLSYGPAS
jgi:hypothetical protein